LFPNTAAEIADAQDEDYIINVRVNGLPFDVTLDELHDRLRELDVDVRVDWTVLANSHSKYQRSPTRMPTSWASIQARNSATLWSLLGGFTSVLWDDRDTEYGDMLGFHLDDNEASLRITFAPAGKRTSLLSLMHAVGFQEEEAKRLLIDALVRKGIPALWIHFDDSTPRQGNQLGALCPWHSASGGIRVIFANEGVAQKMLDRYKDRSFTIDMTVILRGLSPTLQQWLNQHKIIRDILINGRRRT
jgi:hypothetical protein